ncbi:hypothetical protein ACIXQ7_21330 [Bacteroides fragilis]
MSTFYYVNKNAQPTGEHEVHALGCKYLPSEENRIYLGFFTNSRDAIREAKNTIAMWMDVSFVALNHIRGK